MNRIGSILVLTLLVAGCGVVRNTKRTIDTQSPVAQVTSVRVVEQTQQGARIEALLDLTNPNADIALPLVKADYRLTVAGETYHFNDLPLRTLPSKINNGHQVVMLAGAIPATGRVSGAPYEIQGRIHYNPPGEIRKVLTDSGVPLPTVAFSSSGRLD